GARISTAKTEGSVVVGLFERAGDHVRDAPDLRRRVVLPRPGDGEGVAAGERQHPRAQRPVLAVEGDPPAKTPALLPVGPRGHSEPAKRFDRCTTFMRGNGGPRTSARERRYGRRSSGRAPGRGSAGGSPWRTGGTSASWATTGRAAGARPPLIRRAAAAAA